MFPDSQSGEAAPRESVMTGKTVKMGPLSESGAVASQWCCSVDCWWLMIKSPVSLRAVTSLRSAAASPRPHNVAILGSGRRPQRC